jgi:hypothetical protein
MEAMAEAHLYGIVVLIKCGRIWKQVLLRSLEAFQRDSLSLANRP